MRILITGASGLLGRRLFEILSREHEVIGTYNNNKSHKCHYLDISDRESVGNFFKKVDPDIVVHCAALVNPDYCEENQEQARLINIQGTQNIVDRCRKHDCKMIFLSSDFVFDGEGGPYYEDSPMSSVNYYGVTKIEGERIVKEGLNEYLIIRPALMYGCDENSKDSFITQILRKLQMGEILELDNEIIKYPTLTDDVVEAIRKLIDLDLSGEYNVCSEEGVTKFNWAKRIARFYGLSEDNILEGNSKGIAKRPRNVKLDSTKIKRHIFSLTGIEDGIKIANNQKGCAFMLIYSTRPDKLVQGENVSTFRINVGKELAREDDLEADMVVPVPETGIFPATGYADESKIPFYFGVIRDYFTDKTLFQPNLKMRASSLDKKLIVIPEVVRGKRIILVDEAIVSGTTLHVIVDKLKSAGAKEIHVRIPSPTMVNECNYGKLEKYDDLIASRCGGDKNEIEGQLAKHFGVDSLKFLSLEGFLKYLDHNKRPCFECFSKEKVVNIR